MLHMKTDHLTLDSVHDIRVENQRIIVIDKQADACPAFKPDTLNRESLATFASHPVYIIVHSSVPAKQTHIHVTTLNHRLIVNGNKIRMVIMLCMQESERGLLFKLYNELYGSDFNPNDCRFMKTRNEFLDFLSDNCVK